MPAPPASAATATDRNVKPSGIIMAREAGRISVGECRGRDSNPHAPTRGHPILSRARLTSFATPAPAGYRRYLGPVPALPVEGRGDLLRRFPDDDGDLLVVLEDELLRVPDLLDTVHVPLEPVAVGAEAPPVQEHAPLGEELAERVVQLARGLHVDDVGVRMRVQLGDVRIVVDPDQGWD